MVIAAVNQGLAALLRVALPLPEDIGDISFDVPERSWGSQLSRQTVNLYLYNVARSSQPSGPGLQRQTGDGRIERHRPLPMIQLSYMVSAWAGSTADEHQLLSELLSVLVSHQAIPAEHLPEDFTGVAQLTLSQREGRRPGDLWNGLEGRMKPVLELEVTLPIPPRDWTVPAPEVTRITGRVLEKPGTETEEAAPGRATVSRTADGSLEAVAVPPADSPPGAS